MAEPADAAIVTALREAGAVVLGRTNVAQLGLFAESAIRSLVKRPTRGASRTRRAAPREARAPRSPPDFRRWVR